ncbi:MAG: DUF2183 domain-containing protein [Verrucomicrobiales bacterium]|nr:DUF2183 domain-containing protein [Verrucomicrobiales bacterium]
MVPLFARPEIQPDEEVFFYPSWARWDEAGNRWTARLEACVFEPEKNSLSRSALLAALRRMLGLSKGEESTWFDERMRLFLVDHERGKRVRVRIGESVVCLESTGANGHAAAEVALAKEAAPLCQSPDAAHRHGWLRCDAVLPPGDPRHFFGRLQCISPCGVSVISDLDDTIKITGVTNRQEMLANTFCKPWQPVPGMPELYRHWEQRGAAFHYLSASPRLLCPALEEFRADCHFPAGSWTLRPFRLTDRTISYLFTEPNAFKKSAIARLLADFPKRQFILVGDSGEQDPEIYAAVARAFSDQILRIFIRNLPEASRPDAAYASLFAGVPSGKWKVFRKPEEIADESFVATNSAIR